MSIRKILVGAIVLIGMAAWFPLNSAEMPVAAQDGGDDEACTDLYEEALQIVGTACAEMGRDEACYGHFALNTELQADSETQFEASGDLINVIDIQSLETQAADPENGIWGVALLQLQADLPDDSDDMMTVVLFGDVGLENTDLTDVDDAELQSFSLQTDHADTCEMLPDGLMVRSPDGQRARVMINGVELTFSSIGFITENDTGDMVIQGIDGRIEVSAMGQTEAITPGFFTSVPLANFQPSGIPTPPEPVDDDMRIWLPVLFAFEESFNTNAIGSPSTPQYTLTSGTWQQIAVVNSSTCPDAPPIQELSIVLETTPDGLVNYYDVGLVVTYTRVGINTYMSVETTQLPDGRTLEAVRTRTLVSNSSGVGETILAFSDGCEVQSTIVLTAQ